MTTCANVHQALLAADAKLPLLDVNRTHVLTAVLVNRLEILTAAAVLKAGQVLIVRMKLTNVCRQMYPVIMVRGSLKGLQLPI